VYLVFGKEYWSNNNNDEKKRKPIDRRRWRKGKENWWARHCAT